MNFCIGQVVCQAILCDEDLERARVDSGIVRLLLTSLKFSSCCSAQENL